MGYRSDVSIAIYGPAAEMRALVAAQRIAGNNVLETDNAYVTWRKFAVHVEEDSLLLSAEFNDVKWYESYDGVRHWRDLLRAVEDHYADTLSYEFLRVGEEDDDVDREYFGDAIEYFTTTRTEIRTDFPGERIKL